MTAIDWESKPEPWRSVGLKFSMDVARIMAGYITPIAERRPPPLFRAGQRMADYRRARGMTLRQLGEVSGYNAGMLSEFERACRNPTKSQRADIAQSLGVDVEDIWW